MTKHVSIDRIAAAPSRRQFMVGVAGMTFAVIGGGTGDALAAMPAAASGGKAISPWVSIAADGTIFIMSPAAEMGQGSGTSLPLILAEELDADWAKVRTVNAPPNDAIYANPFFRMMYTAGSTAVRAYYKNLRVFGAQVRRVLLDNAAAKLGVPVAELTTEPNVVVHAASGRRLSYGEIAGFAVIPAKAPEIKDADLKDPAKFRLIGKDVMRVELPSKVNGTAQYSIDVQLPDMVYGAVLRSPVEGGAPRTIDDAKARAVNGVMRVVTLPYGVGVIAQTPWAAFAAKDALAVTWSKDAVGWGFDSEKGAGAFAAAARDMTRPTKVWETAGDAPAALKQAASVYEAEFRCDFAYHAQMEPLNATALVAAGGDSCEIWCGTQGQTISVNASAQALGIKPDKVKLHDMLLGGGFGRRGPRDADFVVDAVLLANDLRGRPVKVMWTREDDVHNGRFHPLTAHYLRAGFDAKGELIAWQHRRASDLVTAYQDPVRYKLAKERDFIGMLGTELKTYNIPNRLAEQVAQDSGMRTNALRGIGFGPNKHVTEAFLDEIAVKRGIDPVKFRLDLLKDSPRGRRVVEAVAEMANWGGKPAAGRGRGFAYIDYSDTQLASVAEVSVDRASGEIRVHDFWVTIDCGVAVQPDNVVAQQQGCIIYGLGLALSERVTMADGAVQQNNFYDYIVPRMRDLPNIHVKIIPTANPPSGAGQMATPLVPPAIANAVAALTGVRLRELPMTPERVKKALA
ncbi:MAG: xanthine dehydrogenase family protein molybdopterin-binding subunit [Proteobacteria bacterium]|nr:xanthine dehydrogenase family protein molybdopterin-binding subunit [Pseudomonadota bacterium]